MYMNLLKRMASPSFIDSSAVRDANRVWERQAIPYLGTYIPPAGGVEYDWESFFLDDVNVRHPENLKNIGQSRAISDNSLYNNPFGIPRPSFDLVTCDIIGSNPFYILPETIVCNYLRSVEFDVTDASGERVDYAYKFFKNPNPQSDFWDVFIPMVRDLLRYDAGVIVKTFTVGGWLAYLKPYRGPEFWAEIDKMFFTDVANPFGNASGSYLSHGYICRWWQHTAQGLFIPFKPEEVSYFMLYPNAGSVYGTDIMKHFRFHFKGLMSGTVVFGKIMDNGLVTNLVFKHPDIASRETLRKRLAGLQNENTGAQNYGKTLHLIGNEEVTTVSHNLMDMQYIESQKFGITIIANLFGIPASEFSFESAAQSRSSSSRDRDIRNSRMLSTLLTLIEGKINREMLPHLRGYNESWTFSFNKVTNKDDELKQATITQTNMASLVMAVQQAGMPVDIAIKLTGFGSQLSSEERDRIMDMVSTLPSDVPTNDVDGGRYDGDDYNETFMGYDDVDTTMGEIRHVSGGTS